MIRNGPGPMIRMKMRLVFFFGTIVTLYCSFMSRHVNEEYIFHQGPWLLRYGLFRVKDVITICDPLCRSFRREQCCFGGWQTSFQVLAYGAHKTTVNFGCRCICKWTASCRCLYSCFWSIRKFQPETRCWVSDAEPDPKCSAGILYLSWLRYEYKSR